MSLLPPRHRPRSPRVVAVRGTALRAAIVLAGLAAAIGLQAASPAWQSRIDGFAAALGMPIQKCAETANASAPSSSNPAAVNATRSAMPASASMWQAAKAPQGIVPVPFAGLTPAL